MREVLNYIKYLKDEKRFAKFFEEDERLKILEVGVARVIAETEKSQCCELLTKFYILHQEELVNGYIYSPVYG